MTNDLFSHIEPAWFASPEIDAQNSPIVLMSGVKIRRNIEGFPFPARCDKSELFDSAALSLGGIGRSPEWSGVDFRQIDSLDDGAKQLLQESRLITSQLAQGGAGRFFLCDEYGIASCMINEEDHIILSVKMPGMDLHTANMAARRMEGSINVDLAQDAVLGYLTANPRYVGSGMHAFVLLHLPALDALDDTPRVAAAFERDWKRVSFYKLLSDPNNANGSFYLVSNNVTLGVTPEEIESFVSDAAHSVVSKELFARHKIMNAKNLDMKDRFWRAWGLLRHARKLSYTEAINKFSFIKLGADLGILPKVEDREWRRMVMHAQRHHLGVSTEKIMEVSDEPFVRAALFRRFIEEKSAGAKLGSANNGKEMLI